MYVLDLDFCFRMLSEKSVVLFYEGNNVFLFI